VPLGDAAAGAQQPLVMLQLLLPGKLLRDIAAGEKTAFIHPSELGINPEWSSPSVLKAGRVTAGLMCSLLSPEAAHGDHAAGRAAAAAAAAARAVAAAEASAQAGAAPAGAPEPVPGPLESYGDEVQLPPLTPGAGLVRKRSLSGVRAWQLPNATNQLALLFGPHSDPGLSLTFGVEMFEPGHRTTRHIHTAAYEMFIVLGGEGLGINGKEKVPLRAGDVAVFPPHIVHAIDNPSDRRMYCLQVRRAWRGRPGALGLG
jgi:quercetin dioxygenase-like cupin family protein